MDEKNTIEFHLWLNILGILWAILGICGVISNFISLFEKDSITIIYFIAFIIDISHNIFRITTWHYIHKKTNKGCYFSIALLILEFFIYSFLAFGMAYSTYSIMFFLLSVLILGLWMIFNIFYIMHIITCKTKIICPYCNNKNNPKREYCYMCGKKICKEKDIPSHVEYQQFLKDNFSNDDTKTYINNLRMSPIETENDLNTLEKETNFNNEENENNCTFRFVYCGKCGSKNIIEDNYCTKCGYKLRK